jgi:hypothetical protein
MLTQAASFSSTSVLAINCAVFSSGVVHNTSLIVMNFSYFILRLLLC